MHARAAVLAAFGGLAIGVFSGISAAQTCTGWFPPDPTAGPLGTVNAITTFDPDGEGPLPEWIIFGGRFTVAGDVISPNVVAWDGAQFIPLPGLNGEVWSLKVFDADGGGPLPPRLYAGGSFGQPSSGFSVWNGESWQSTGANFLGQATVFTMEVYDEDGVGPNPPRLFLGGIFSIAPVTSAFNIARFDGTQLSSLPTGWFSGFLQYVHEMEVFDFDADGPEEPRLVLVGTFSFVQTPPLNNLNGIVTWNGQQFASLGSGLGVNNASSAALPAPRGILGFDPDRNGTAPPVLVAGNITPLLWGGTQTGWSPAEPPRHGRPCRNSGSSFHMCAPEKLSQSFWPSAASASTAVPTRYMLSLIRFRPARPGLSRPARRSVSASPPSSTQTAMARVAWNSSSAAWMLNFHLRPRH